MDEVRARAWTLMYTRGVAALCLVVAGLLLAPRANAVPGTAAGYTSELRLLELSDAHDPFSPGTADDRCDLNLIRMTFAAGPLNSKNAKPTGGRDILDLLNSDKTTNRHVMIRATIAIRDGGGTIVRRLSGSTDYRAPLDVISLPSKSGGLLSFARLNLELTWDGRDEAMSLVSDGEFDYEVSADLFTWADPPTSGRWDIVTPVGDYTLATADPAHGQITVDNTPPVVTIAAIPRCTNTDVTPSFEATDEHLRELTALLDGKSFSLGDLVAAEGQHVLTVTAEDEACNRTEASISFAIDRTPPVVQVTVPTQPFVNVDVIPSISVTEPNEPTVTATLDGKPYTVGTSVSAEGTHTLTVIAIDCAGNQSVSGPHTFGIDKSPPTFERVEPAPCPAETRDARPIVRGCFADALAGVLPASVRLVVDGTDRTAEAMIEKDCIAWVPRENLTSTQHTAEVQAEDLAGNAGNRSWCFKIAAAAQPLTVVIDEPSGPQLSRASYVDIRGHVELQGSALAEVLVNTVPAVVSGSRFVARGVPLHEGVNSLTATARDRAERVGSATLQITRDTTAPRLVITVPRDGGVIVAPPGVPVVDPLTRLRQGGPSWLDQAPRPTLRQRAQPSLDKPMAYADVAGEVNDTVVGTVNAAEASITVNGVPAMVMNRGFRALHVPIDPETGEIIAIGVDAAGNESLVTTTVRVAQYESKKIVEISGNNQTGVATELLPDPLTVELRDEFDQPAIGIEVIFRVARGDGTFESGERSIAVETGPDGRASVRYRSGGRFGCANNRVEASSAGYSGRVYFTADATPLPPDKVHIVSGLNQLGIAGKRLPDPFVVIAFDEHDNPISDLPITFRVIKGGGRFDDGADRLVVETDSNGWASAFLTMGPLEGNENNVVEASFQDMAKLAARFSASGRTAGTMETRVVGLVFDNTDAPIPGATVSILDTELTTTTDEQGRFAISNSPVGTVHIKVDGATTTRDGEWPSLVFRLVTVPGRDNDIGRPMYLPVLNPEGVTVSESQGGIATVSTVPGLRLEVAPGSATFGDGTKTGMVSITQVHPDKVPMPPPMGMAPPIVIAIMPHDVLFDPPAKITIPNLEGLSPGETTELFSFDHDLEMFISIGTGTVTVDGASIVSDPGQGVIKGGWHCGGPATSKTHTLEHCNRVTCKRPTKCDPNTGVCEYVNRGRGADCVPYPTDNRSCMRAYCDGNGSCSNYESLELLPLPDPDPQIDESNLSTRLKDALACVRRQGGALESGYRTSEYQRHLRDVWANYQALEHCQFRNLEPWKSLWEQALGEKRKHKIGFQPARNSRHTSNPATAMDITPRPSEATLKACCLTREGRAPDDEGHVIATGSAECGTPREILELARFDPIEEVEYTPELDDSCTVLVGNNSARVQADGSYVLRGPVPPGGAVRPRALCTYEDGNFILSTAYVDVSAADWIFPGEFTNPPPATPTQLRLSIDATELTRERLTALLTVNAEYADGSSLTIDLASTFVTLMSTNASVASISGDGVITALRTGNASVMAVFEGVSGAVDVRVRMGGSDTDGDGVPDDAEVLMGLDPADSTDGSEDRDDDGLSNSREFQLGTDPLLSDTDGDQVHDGRECRPSEPCTSSPLLVDSDFDGVWDGLDPTPTDARCDDYAAVILSGSERISPPTLEFQKNSLGVEVSQQLRVLATMRDGRALDLSHAARCTQYRSSDLLIAFPANDDGLIIAGNNGEATITVSNDSLFTIDVPVHVGTFQPSSIPKHVLTGVPGDVRVDGGFAYVAVGGAGVQVFDVTNPNSVRDLGTFDTPGSASDVETRGGAVYVADGDAGLTVLQFSGGASATARSDRFDGAVINQRSWTSKATGDSASVFQAGGSLQFRVGPEQGAYAAISTEGKWQLAGDFDIQTDWAIASFGALHQFEQFYVEGGGYQFAIERLLTFDGRDVFLANDSYQGVPGAGNETGTSLMAGQYRLTREADIYTAYWRASPSDAWSPLRRNRLGWSGPVAVILDANNGPNQGAIEASFDNFVVNSGTERGSLAVIAQVPLPAPASALAIQGDLAYVVGDALGLAIIDLSQAPRIGPTDLNADGVDDRILSLDLSLAGTRNVAAEGNLVALARGGRGVTLVDVSDPSQPKQLRTVPTDDAYATAIRDGLIYVADGNNSQSNPLKVIDARDPNTAQVIGSLPDRFLLTDIALQGPYAIASDSFSVNRVPVISVADPSRPSFPFALGFESQGDHNGVGVDVHGGYAYMVGCKSDECALFIGQFAATDRDRTPPSVRITSPVSGTAISEGALVEVKVDALDDVGIDHVAFRVDETVVATHSLAPFEASVRAGAVGTSLKIDAVAYDLAGNARVSEAVLVSVTKDFQPPQVSLTSPSAGAQLYERVLTNIAADASDDVKVAKVEFRAGGVLIGTDDSPPFATTARVPAGVSTWELEARAFDQAGNSYSDHTIVTVLRDPGTTVIGRVIDENNAAVVGARVESIGEVAGTSSADGSFRLDGVPTVLGSLVLHASVTRGDIVVDGLSQPLAAVSGGVTDIGEIRLSELFGDGRDGDLVTNNLDSRVNRTTRLVADAAAGASELAVAGSEIVVPGDEILVIQLQGPSAGEYEFARISGVADGSVALARPLVHSFRSTDGVANIVRVPHFRNLTVQSGTRLEPEAWDGEQGGVLVARVSANVLVQENGQIGADERGFRGGYRNTLQGCAAAGGYQGESVMGPSTVFGSTQPNVGGGGAGAPDGCVGCAGDSPAGGGGYGTRGSDSQNPGGQGFAGLGGNVYGSPNLFDSILHGSGGGESHWAGYPGGNGGGIVMLFARSIDAGRGLITSDGQDGSTAYGHPSGAGSGGAVLIVSDRVDAGEQHIHALGGKGSVQTPCTACCGSFEREVGGDGGRGRMLIRARRVDGTIESCAPIPSDASGWWPAEESLNDVIGTANGTWRGTPAFADARVGKGFRLDGGNAVFVDQTFLLHEITNATLEFWVNPDNPFFDQAIFWTRPDGSDGNRFNILVNGGQLIVDYRAPNGSLHYLGAAPVVAGGWTHIAIVRTVAPTHVYRIYRNGELASEVTDPAPNLPTAVGWTMSGRGCCMFRGVLDEVSTYRRALSQAEIREIVAAEDFGKCR